MAAVYDKLRCEYRVNPLGKVTNVKFPAQGRRLCRADGGFGKLPSWFKSVKFANKSNRRFPARLHVLLAREARCGLVIRRGPAGSVCTIRWDLSRDLFQLGQWMRGRLYERRSDLSPDGRYFIYFAHNFSQRSPAALQAWTAISRSPFLKAVALFDKGDCWHGGGLFLGKRRFWLNDGYGHNVVRDTSEVIRDRTFRPSEYLGGECPGVYYIRLQRDGWQRVSVVEKGPSHEMVIFEKPLPGGWVLRKTAHAQVNSGPGKGCYWDKHELEHKGRGELLGGDRWEWTDTDGRRLLWAEDGKLFGAFLKSAGLVDQHLINDFNDMAFEAIAAPY